MHNFARFAAVLQMSLSAHRSSPKMPCIVARALSERVTLDGTADDVADIFERNLAGPQQQHSHHVSTTRSEALSLYRKIQRYTLLFDWPDEHGQLWRDKLRRSAREEFEAAKFERDPLIVTRLLLTSDQAVEQVMEKFLQKRRQLEEAGQLPRRITSPPSEMANP